VGYGFPTGNTTAAIIGGPLSGVSGIGFTNLSGVVAGGQLGGNYQIDRFVFGVEGDFDWSGQSKSGAAGILSETVRLPWMATIRGRGGIAFDRVLVYGTAGIAFINASDSLVESGAGTIYNPSSTSTGLAAGAGVEFAFAQNWTARMEYLYIGTNLTLSGPLALIGGTVTENGKLNDSLVRAGISFKYP
jgi:outer membrane immunogenic protein